MYAGSSVLAMRRGGLGDSFDPRLCSFNNPASPLNSSDATTASQAFNDCMALGPLNLTISGGGTPKSGSVFHGNPPPGSPPVSQVNPSDITPGFSILPAMPLLPPGQTVLAIPLGNNGNVLSPVALGLANAPASLATTFNSLVNNFESAFANATSGITLWVWLAAIAAGGLILYNFVS